MSPVGGRMWELGGSGFRGVFEALQGESMSPEGAGEQGGRHLGGGAIASLTGVGVLLIFVVQNTEDVKFDFLFLSFTWPLWLYTIVTALFGALVWFGLGVMRRHRRRKERREDRRD